MPIVHPLIQQPVPSDGYGYARCGAESEAPELWDSLRGLWAVGCGLSRSEIIDLGPHRVNAVLAGGVIEYDPEYGRGINVDTGTNGPLITSRIDELDDEFSIFGFVRHTTTGNRYIYDQRHPRISVISSNNIGIHIAGATIAVSHGLVYGDGLAFVWTVRDTPDERIAWVNGERILENTDAFTKWGLTSPGAARILDQYTVGRRFNQSAFLIGVSSRAWPAGECFKFTTDPYAILRLRRRVFAAVAAGPAPTGQPIIRRVQTVPHLAGRQW